MVSLNFVKADDQSLYQTGKDDGEGGGEDPEDKPPGKTDRSSADIKAQIKEVCRYANL